MNIRPKVVGVARVVNFCHRCGKPIEGDPLFTHVEGRLVALHPEHKENEPWRQTPA
jgi:hypothetical protein